MGGADEALHLFALRQELRSLTFLHLEPSAAAQPSDIVSGDDLDPRGANLAKVLARLQAETASADRSEGVIADIRQELTARIPEVVGLRVQRDEAARKFQIFARQSNGAEFASQLLSDGTVRLLALITCLYDDRRHGTLCFEEPENGIHEARIPGVIDLLRRFSTDLSCEPEPGERLSQIIVNSHSPVVLDLLKPAEVVAAAVIDRLDPGSHSASRITRMRAGMVDEFDLASDADPEARLTRFETKRLLQRNKSEVVP